MFFKIPIVLSIVTEKIPIVTDSDSIGHPCYMNRINKYLTISDVPHVMGCCTARPLSSSTVRQFSSSSSSSSTDSVADIVFIDNTRDDIAYITTARLDTVEEVEEVKEVKLGDFN